ncbi:hypothetical protein [Myxococcus sp. RHSTA-1-4]|uniref:hypothetical protein n=1 Tax=Myxococcus sp. RHSTA-1-4 TaxID=2874601 RepID=UPI001CBC6B5E|nr:hypothetical protein [Myxococcus sp. RHSTA-1-4]
MKALVEFIEKYRPGFSEEVVPADELAIAHMEKYAGPLPGAYRRFLQTMGASMGGLELAEADFAIEGNIGTYLVMDWPQRERYIYVAGDDGLAGWDYFLDRTRPHGADDCMLVRMPLDENFPPEASRPKHVGLEEFLYYSAFKELRLPLLPHRWEFSSPEDPKAAAQYRADLVPALAEEQGFQRLPPAEHCALYERGDAGLLLYRHPTEPTFSFSLGCEDPVEMERLARDFEARTGLKGKRVK